MGDALQVHQRGGNVPHRHIFDLPGQGHGGAGGAHVGVRHHLHQAAAAADPEQQLLPPYQQALPGQQHAVGTGGVAAELAAHHLQYAMDSRWAAVDKAHLLHAPVREGHQFRRQGGALLLRHVGQHQGGDVASRVGPDHLNRFHRW